MLPVPRPLEPKNPIELVGYVNRLVGWVKISNLPPLVRAELLLNLSRCIALLAGVSNGQETQQVEDIENEEAGPQSTEKVAKIRL